MALRGFHPEPAFCEPESDHLKDVECTKNPGHKHFIPVKHLTMRDFPVGYRDPWRVDWVRAMAELTVMVKVRAVSKERPETHPESGNGYPFYIDGGGVSLRRGSGFVWQIHKCGDGSTKHKTCKCDACDTCLRLGKVWWEVRIITALHVVYDDAETKDTEVTFFYDEADCETFQVKGHSIIGAYLEGDWAAFTVIVRKKEVAERLETALSCYKNLRKQNSAQLGDPVVIVSHPHGCPKHVTVGEMVEESRRRSMGNYTSPPTYTARTCPGCSGGSVLGQWGDTWGRWCVVYCRHPHSGADENNCGTSGWGGWWWW